MQVYRCEDEGINKEEQTRTGVTTSPNVALGWGRYKGQAYGKI